VSKTKFDPSTLNQPGKEIVWFDDFNQHEGNDPTNTYRFLSNFYVGEPFTLAGLRWGPEDDLAQFKTGEHAFQAMKALSEEDFKAIVDSPTPSEAKKLGRTCKTDIARWDSIRFDVMAAVVRSKFTLDREEGPLLLATGHALLMEGTQWGDQVWGVDMLKEGWPGRNWLGTLLMARRAELIYLTDNPSEGDLNTALHNIYSFL
jgi:ribA/ribD-fused uncharacterized protein